MVLKNLRAYRWYLTGRWKIKRNIVKAAKQGEKLKIVLGTGYTNYKGWISTDLPHFNILKKSDWEYFFSTYKVDNLLAEHVLEHLTEDQVREVLALARKYLKEGGVFRVAVPDANHSNPKYIESVRPGGSGEGAHDHKSFWEFRTLVDVSKNEGFDVALLEYYDENKELHFSDLDLSNGQIERSISRGFIDIVENYSSLIVDLKKS